MLTIARKVIKVLCFILLSMMIGRSVDIYRLVSVDTAIALSNKLFGEGGQENVEAVYALISAVTIIVLTTVIFLIVMTLIRCLRKA